MTTQSALIEKLLSYSATDWAVTDAEAARAIRVLSTDPSVDATIADLHRSGFLRSMFDRLNSGSNLEMLAQVLGGKVSASAAGLIRGALAGHPDPGKTFKICFTLHSKLRTFGALSPGTAISSATLASKTAPFTGSGATGVDPASLQIGAVDKLLLGVRNPTAVGKYTNPIPGSLSAYLRGLSPTTRRAQAATLIRMRINTAYPSSYGSLPSRASIFRAAGSAYNLEPELVATFVLAEQRDQSQLEDAKDYTAATSIMQGDTSIGLGQVVVSTATRESLFADFVPTSVSLSHDETSRLLTSDEFNIFAVAKYIRRVADAASALSASTLPNTVRIFPAIQFSAFALNSSAWPADNIRALASEYTSKAWDDKLHPGWSYFVYEAYQDVQSAHVL